MISPQACSGALTKTHEEEEDRKHLFKSSNARIVGFSREFLRSEATTAGWARVSFLSEILNLVRSERGRRGADGERNFSNVRKLIGPMLLKNTVSFVKNHPFIPRRPPLSRFRAAAGKLRKMDPGCWAAKSFDSSGPARAAIKVRDFAPVKRENAVWASSVVKFLAKHEQSSAKLKHFAPRNVEILLNLIWCIWKFRKKLFSTFSNEYYFIGGDLTALESIVNVWVDLRLRHSERFLCLRQHSPKIKQTQKIKSYSRKNT